MTADKPAGSETSGDADLFGAWQTLIRRHSSSAQCADIGRWLLVSWSESHRRYHNIAHLREVLLRVDELAGHAVDADAVRLAAWYHDVVYSGRRDDEETSARRAETELAAIDLAPGLVREVARLVRLTGTHRPSPGDWNGETLCDADLAILAELPDRYAAYTSAVRSEYADVSDEAFRVGRSRVLRALLDAPGVYRTPVARQNWEEQARANLRAELRRLTASEDMSLPG